MADNRIKTEDFTETKEELENGHADVREQNFRCENKDEHLGCDLGIDVAG
ncbi:MAG: hypothetical protein ACQEQS_03200 [Thermodesulfobacteriota bacterium]